MISRELILEAMRRNKTSIQYLKACLGSSETVLLLIFFFFFTMVFTLDRTFKQTAAFEVGWEDQTQEKREIVCYWALSAYYHAGKQTMTTLSKMSPSKKSWDQSLMRKDRGRGRGGKKMFTQVLSHTHVCAFSRLLRVLLALKFHIWIKCPESLEWLSPTH